MMGASRPRERADARANRERILEAAAALFTAREPSTVTMSDIAAAAGVGRATLYRRYPDVATIAHALLDEHERRLQDRMIGGPPPLGPGAPPAERLAAFYGAMVDLLEHHLPLALGRETGEARYRTGAYEAWRLHVSVLVRAAHGRADPALIDILLAPLAPDVYRYQRHTVGLPPHRIADSLADVARRVLAPSG